MNLSRQQKTLIKFHNDLTLDSSCLSSYFIPSTLTSFFTSLHPLIPKNYDILSHWHLIKRNLTSDRLSARRAPLREQFAEAFSAVGLLVPRREPLAGQRRAAVGAREALAVPRLVLVRHAALRDDLEARRLGLDGRELRIRRQG